MQSLLTRLDKNRAKTRRYKNTWRFLSQTVKPPLSIVDIGTPNDFSEFLKEQGFTVTNTSGRDLDDFPEDASVQADVATAFEIFEHLLNPYGVLKAISAKRLVASIPLSLWFAKSYRNKKDKWDQHFHEFEDWQFDWLLEKAGWEVVRREKWTSPIRMPGFRPLLRLVTPRYYIVEARRKA